MTKQTKLIGLSYPGGSEIEQQALKGNEDKFVLPKPLVERKKFYFSFSGIKQYKPFNQKNKLIKKSVTR